MVKRRCSFKYLYHYTSEYAESRVNVPFSMCKPSQTETASAQSDKSHVCLEQRSADSEESSYLPNKKNPIKVREYID